MAIKGTPVLSEEEVDEHNDDDDGCSAGYDGDCGGDELCILFVVFSFLNMSDIKPDY